MNPKLKVSSQHCGSVKDEVNRFEIEEGLDVQLHMGMCPLLELEAKQEVQYLNVVDVEDTCTWGFYPLSVREKGVRGGKRGTWANTNRAETPRRRK